MLGLKVNKKLLQSHLSQKSGQVTILKDLHNMAASSQGSSLSVMEEAIEVLKKFPGMSFVYL